MIQQKELRMWMPDAKMKLVDVYYQNNEYLTSFTGRVLNTYVVNHPTYLSFELEDRLTEFIGTKDKNDNEIYTLDLVEIGDVNYIVQFIEGEYVMVDFDNPKIIIPIHRVEKEDIELVGHVLKYLTTPKDERGDVDESHITLVKGPQASLYT